MEDTLLTPAMTLYTYRHQKCSEGCSASGPHTKYLPLLLCSFNIT